MPVRLVTDSTSYIPQGLSEDLGIRIVPLYVNFQGLSQDETSLDAEAFYKWMETTGQFPTSSQPSVERLRSALEAPVLAGEDVVGVFLSGEMSGTFATAQLAREMVLRDHPAARIELIDSRTNSMELGFPVIAGARAAMDGASPDEVCSAVRETMTRTRFLFVPRTLEYLKRGGRIGGASALVGALLEIRPILTVEEGRTEVVKKVRSHDRAIAEMVARFRSDIEAFGLSDAIVHHIHDSEAGGRLAEELAGVTGREVPAYLLGVVIGLHVGPGTVGIVYVTERPSREEASG